MVKKDRSAPLYEGSESFIEMWNSRKIKRGMLIRLRNYVVPNRHYLVDDEGQLICINDENSSGLRPQQVLSKTWRHTDGK